jgi:hypothetical protein
MTDVSPDHLWTPLVDLGTHWCAPNVHAHAQWLDVDSDRWRVALTRPCERNSYVVSATGQYLDYALEETRRIASRALRALSRAALLPMAPVLRALDPIVVLDALPVSTVLHERRSQARWRAALERARIEFRGLPIVVRSVDPVASQDLLSTLREIGMALIPSRLVFHQDPRHGDFWRIRNVRRDLALCTETPLESRNLTTHDSPQIAALYWQLYGEKHSELNPQFTAAWMAHGIAQGVLSGEGLIHDGRLAAAYLSYSVENVMTNPVFGYDTTLPQQLGLYRRLSVLTMRRAQSHGHRLHASSGAPGFKASRGGVPTLEYHAVDLRGVRGRQHAAWLLTLRVADAIGPRLLRSAK